MKRATRNARVSSATEGCRQEKQQHILMHGRKCACGRVAYLIRLFKRS
jgi:hypothetical protein